MTRLRQRADAFSTSPLVVLTVGIFAVSTASILIRYAQPEVPSLTIGTYRLAIASLVLLPFALGHHWRELRELQARDWVLGIASGVFLALHFATWITSLEYTTVASSVVLVTTSPLWVALGGWLLLHERLRRPIILGLMLTVTGGIIIGAGDTLQGPHGASLFGNALALTGAVMVAGYWLIGRRLRARLPLLPYVAVVYCSAAVASLMMTLGSHQSLMGYEPMVYLWLVLLGLVPQLIGHSSFNWALARLPATFVAIATLGEPIGSTLLACLLLNEMPSLLGVFGGALVLTGIVLTFWSKTSSQKPMRNDQST